MFRENKNWLIAFAVLLLAYPFMTNLEPYTLQIILLCGINVILATSLNLVNGFTGQFSMGHAGFMSVGAYTSATLTTVVFPSLFSSSSGSILFIFPLLAGGLVACLMGFVVGLPSLRLRGDYLSIVTLGFGEIIRVLMQTTDYVGASRGLPGIPPIAGFGWIYGSMLVTLFVLWRIVNSRYGRSFIAVREDEIAAEAMGVPTTKTKVRAFMVGAFFAGIAGALFAHLIQIITPAIFDFNKSFEIIMIIVFGGMGSLSGSIIAAIFLTILREKLRGLQEFTFGYDLRMIIYSFLLIILMLSRPEGLMGRKEISDFFKRFFNKNKEAVQS